MSRAEPNVVIDSSAEMFVTDFTCWARVAKSRCEFFRCFCSNGRGQGCNIVVSLEHCDFPGCLLSPKEFTGRDVWGHGFWVLRGHDGSCKQASVDGYFVVYKRHGK